MKLHFNSELDYQKQAILSAVDLFKGQTSKQSSFTISKYDELNTNGTFLNITGIGNKLEINKETILKNLQEIQLRNCLKKTEELNSYEFDVEMETGTGKTYVYLRTILELNKKYGFSKFIIVVPNIAIKEGVFKTLDITKEHFKNLYDNITYEYFIYDSKSPELVRNFAVNDCVSIMIITMASFNKEFEDESKSNIIHRSVEKLNGAKPINLIAETNPIVIIDEPQSANTTENSKKAISSLNPMCVFNYSATHVEKHNQIYKLDAIDSYNLKLVKQIDVASLDTVDNHNQAYMLLKSVNNKKSSITAKLEIDALVKGAIKRKTITIKQGDDLSEKLSGYRPIYNGYIVDEIYCEKGNEYVSFTSKPEILRIGLPIGDINPLEIKEQQIRKTIEEHLNKELVLNPLGIKVLSLFFIDSVEKYRIYNQDGTVEKGIYAQLFEKNFKDIIKKPKYRSLISNKDINIEAENVHDGYFSKDKKGKPKDTKGNTSDDNDTYNLIMKDKEKLLSFESNLRFIFSHSTLREGWDNPNVFQICTLNDTNSEIKKRQEIGRGLRLCVNQKGERQYDSSLNILTIMANESYDEFAKKLQIEYEEDTGIRFGFMESHIFANITTKIDDEVHVLGYELSNKLFEFFMENNYINSMGKVQDKLKFDLKNGTLELPNYVKDYTSQIISICKKISGNLNIKPANQKTVINLNEEVYNSDDFKFLWDKIKYKTTYSIDFDTDTLIENCCKNLKTNLNIVSGKLIYSKATLRQSIGGIDAIETIHTNVASNDCYENLPDIVTYLQNTTNLTRKTIVSILLKSDTLQLFKKNPQQYMEEVSKIILSNMRLLMVKSIKYTKINNNEYYPQELFKTKNLMGYVGSNAIKSEKSVYDYILYDSANEEHFAQSFENNTNIKLYVKLPNWYKIPTPLGSYNPDWAVLFETDENKKLCFVLETKGNISSDALRPTESAKISCGYKHFEVFGDDVTFKDIDNFNKFMEEL